MAKVTHNSIPPLNNLFLASHIKIQFYLTFDRSMGNKKPQHVLLDSLLHNSNCNWSLTESMEVMHKFSGMLHNISCSAPLLLLPYLGSFSSCIHGKSCLTSTFWKFSTRSLNNCSRRTIKLHVQNMREVNLYPQSCEFK